MAPGVALCVVMTAVSPKIVKHRVVGAIYDFPSFRSHLKPESGFFIAKASPISSFYKLLARYQPVL